MKESKRNPLDKIVEWIGELSVSKVLLIVGIFFFILFSGRIVFWSALVLCVLIFAMFCNWSLSKTVASGTFFILSVQTVLFMAIETAHVLPPTTMILFPFSMYFAFLFICSLERNRDKRRNAQHFQAFSIVIATSFSMYVSSYHLELIFSLLFSTVVAIGLSVLYFKLLPSIRVKIKKMLGGEKDVPSTTKAK